MSKLMNMRAQLIDQVTGLPIQDINIITSADAVYFDDGMTFEEKWENGEFIGAAGKDGEDGIAATIKIGKVMIVDSDKEAKVENVGTMNAAILDFTIPRGEKGEDGTGIKILARFDTYEELVATYPDGTSIDGGFLVGPENGPCNYHFWNKRTLKWESMGPIKGEKGLKGDKGDKGEDGTGLSIYDNVDDYNELISKYPDGSICGGKGVITINTGEYWYWNIHTGHWTSIGKAVGVQGPKGDTGESGTVEVYKVNTVSFDTDASVSNVGTPTNAKLVFNIPKGQPGESIVTDDELNPDSDNAISNRAVSTALSETRIEVISSTSIYGGISDLINLL